MKPDFSYRFLIFIFIILPFLGNILISTWAMKIAPLIFTIEVSFGYVNIINQYYYVNIVFVLILFLLFSVIYFYPIILYLSCNVRPIDLEPWMKKRILNAPLILSLIVIPGWLIAGTLGDFIVLSIENFRPDIILQTYLTGMFFSLIGGIFGFVIYYFTLEYFNRNYFIPVMFQGQKISEIHTFFQLSIQSKFFIYFFGVGFLPCLILLAILIRLKQNPSINEVEGMSNTLLIIIPVLLTISLFITFFVSKLYQVPLVRMKNDALKIAKEDYEVGGEINSNDELGVLQESIILMAKELREKAFIKDTFGKIVEPEIRDHLLKGNINLGGELVQIAVLFSDIRNFTNLSERFPPDKILMMLNRYFDKMSNCIREEKGLVNKFIGDAILAIFGAPINIENHSQFALQAAIKMRIALNELNEEFESEGFPSLEIGIGIHSGEVVAGNLGTRTRMEYTVIGDTVNVASRLESLCKEFQTDLIFSESVNLSLKDFQTEPLGSVFVKGKTKSVNIFTIP